MIATKQPVVVQIIAAPVACAEGFRDSWRQLAQWIASQLSQRFGGEVQVEYYALFEAGCPPLPPDAQLPLVLIDGNVFSSGGKIQLPLLRKQLEIMLTAKPDADQPC